MDSEHAIAKAVAETAIREFVAKGDPYVVHHRVQVTSFGGSGTTALTASFVDAGLDLPPGPAQWPHKHVRRPPSRDQVPDGFRVVYPVGDPRDAVLSLFRRGIQDGHWRWLNRMPMDAPVPDRLQDLESFLDAGIDEFGLRDHLEGWLHHPPGYPVMFVRFDLVEQAWEDLAAFVELPAGHPAVSVRTRNSDWRTVPAAMRDRLDEMYGDLAVLIESFPASRVA